MRCHLIWTAALVLAFGSTTVLAQDVQPPPTPPKPQNPYAGAAACKACHAAIYEKWARTTHERAFTRLPSADRQKVDCLACHVTGTPELIAAELDKPSNPGVQCELCHGPARAHAEQAVTSPPAIKGLTRKPGETLCVRCHNDKSPHFRGFVFSAMVKTVH